MGASLLDPRVKPKTMLIVGAVLSAAFGFALLVIPDGMMGAFGLAPDEAGRVLSRDLGVVLLALAVLNWLARDAAPGPALTAILVGNLAVQLLQTVTDGYHILTGQVAPAGWGGVALHVALGIGFALAIVRPSR